MPKDQPSSNTKAQKLESNDEQSQENLVVAAASNAPPIAPDKHTAVDPVFIENGAPNQVFKLSFKGVSYGTDDKGHAASIVLAVMLLALMLIFGIGGMFIERTWMPDVFKFLGTAFTFVAGVAIGKSSSKK